ncbi:glycosyltransferase family 39 protein [Candidatus Woesearchaeota archaeon]|nr:glycosyltransferase family 39 protein [Candidatus Woesearchaeota archaeon]
MRASTILIILLTIGAFLVRVIGLGAPSIWIDEGYSLLAIDMIQEKGYPELPSGELYAPGNVYFYLAAFFTYPFDDKIYWSRMLSVLIGTAFVPVFFVLVKRLFNTRIAMLSTLIVAFMPLEIAWSRQVRHYMLFQAAFVVSTLSMLLWSRYGGQRKKIIGSSTVGMLSHPTGLILPILIGVGYVLKRWQKLNFWYILGFAGLSGFLVHHVSGIFERQRPYFYEYVFYLYTDHTFILFGALIGLLYLTDWRPFYAIYLVMSIAVPLVVIGAFVDLFHLRYLFYLYPLLVLLAVYGLDQLFSRWKVMWRTLAYAVIVVSICLSPLVIFWPTSLLEPMTPQPDFKAAHTNLDNCFSVTLITAWPAVTYAYKGKAHYWLAFDMTGGLLTNYTEDVYIGLPSIANVNDLDAAVQGKSGYVIVDGLSKSRLPSDVLEGIEALELHFSSVTGPNSEVYVYRFDKR